MTSVTPLAGLIKYEGKIKYHLILMKDIFDLCSWQMVC